MTCPLSWFRSKCEVGMRTLFGNFFRSNRPARKYLDTQNIRIPRCADFKKKSDLIWNFWTVCIVSGWYCSNSSSFSYNNCPWLIHPLPVTLHNIICETINYCCKTTNQYSCDNQELKYVQDTMSARFLALIWVVHRSIPPQYIEAPNGTGLGEIWRYSRLRNLLLFAYGGSYHLPLTALNNTHLLWLWDKRSFTLLEQTFTLVVRAYNNLL